MSQKDMMHGTEAAVVMKAVKGIVEKTSQTWGAERDDIVQEVMLKIVNTRSRPRQIGVTWLGTVIRNCISEYSRQQRRENRYRQRALFVDAEGVVRDSWDDQNPLTTAPAIWDRRLDQLEGYDRDELIPKVIPVVQALSKPLRNVLVLLAAGHSYEAIARMTEAKIGTVRSRIFWARKRAKEMLSQAQ